MKHLSVGGMLLTFALALPGAAFTGKTVSPSEKAAAARQVQYYWFSWPGDTPVDRATVTTETNELVFYYDGIPITQSPAGGTLVERGVLNNALPHNQLPAVFLYAHFDD